MNKKYTKEELSKLAQGVFRDDKTSPSIYANDEGTFLNPVQYAKRKEKGEHTEFRFEFKNPNVKAAPSGDESSKNAEIAQLKAELEGKDRRIAELSDEISALESKLALQDPTMTVLPPAPPADAKPARAPRKSNKAKS